jgi:hypothetical protein
MIWESLTTLPRTEVLGLVIFGLIILAFMVSACCHGEGQETDTEANVPSQMTARFRHTKSLIHSSIPVAGHCGHA